MSKPTRSNTPPTQPNPEGLSEQEVEALIDAHGKKDRRGCFKARPVLVQRLNEFGAPHRGVLTALDSNNLTIASMVEANRGDKVVVYDDNAPDGPKSYSGNIDAFRAACRPSDANIAMNIFYLHLDD